MWRIVLNFQAWLERKCNYFRVFYFNGNEISISMKPVTGSCRNPYFSLCLPLCFFFLSLFFFGIIDAPLNCTLQCSPVSCQYLALFQGFQWALSVRAWIIQPLGCWQDPNEARVHQEASPSLQLQEEPPWRQAIIHPWLPPWRSHCWVQANMKWKKIWIGSVHNKPERTQ